MKLERSKDWWLARVRREGVAFVGAGLLAFDPAPEEAAGTVSEERRIAFGRFVNLMRRQRGWTMEKLAEEADLDTSELLLIEEHGQTPFPRTVYKLAETFNVPQPGLMQLSGLAVANDTGFREEAVRFAARSESVEKLTPEENAALEAFVTVLSKRTQKRGK